MTTDISIFELIINASLVVQLIMFMLLAASFWSWTLIIIKLSVFSKARKELTRFERQFWSGVELGELYKKISSKRERIGGLEAIFESGFREFVHLRKQSGLDSMAVVEGAQRAMRVTMNREQENLETYLSFLATVGSTSPYVGLFGTVWGIMNSFRPLGNLHQATIASVAPGIAEALVATAMGLLAAIPAVIAYNRFASDLERIVGRYDNFVEEFSTILQRQAKD